MKPWARQFYDSKAWKEIRLAYLSSVYGLCERCMARDKTVPAKVVHHKTYLRPDNIDDPDITLNWDNLEALCQDCHTWEHHGKYMPINEGLKFDEMGNLIRR